MQNGYKAWLIVPAILLAGLLTVLYVFNPETNTFYPACPLHRTTGFQCATCGGLRAVHSILHGDISAALHYNPLVIIVLCVVLLEAARSFIWGQRLKVWGIMAALILAAMVGFTIMRNI